MRLQYLITGTGRCGTGYAARVLRSAGIPCGHETMYGWREGVEWGVPHLPAESSWLAAPFLDAPAIRGAHVIHLVRHPKHVVESLLRARFFHDDARQPEYAAFALEHLPTLADYDTPLLKAAHLWIEWNRLVERNTREAHLLCTRIQVEGRAERFLEAFGLDTFGQPLYSNRRHNTFSGQHTEANLHELPDDLLDEMLAMCAQYGYDLDAPPPRPPQVYWSFLTERAIQYPAVNAALDIAMVAGRAGFMRISVPYSRTDAVRNKIIEAFQSVAVGRDDVLVMLDCDHAHPPDIIERLASRPEGVVGALAFRRSAPFEPMWFVRQPNGRLVPPATYEPIVYECDAVGTGAIAIKRWVFDALEKLGYQYFFRYEYTDGKQGWRSSEDMFFARICEEAGIKHHVDCSLETPHLRLEQVTGETWAQYRDEHSFIVKPRGEFEEAIA